MYAYVLHQNKQCYVNRLHVHTPAHIAFRTERGLDLEEINMAATIAYT